MPLAGSTKNYVSDLIKAGSDALTNLYYLQFNGGELEKITNALKVRSGDFTPPAFSQTTDTKNFMTVSVDMPKPEIQGEKKLSFTFRVDENYLVYEALVKQKKKTSISNLGYINPNVDKDGNHFTVQVYAYNGMNTGVGDTSGSFKKLYEFRNCWIREINGLTYGYDSSTPLTVKVEVSFQDFDDPENLLFV